MRIKEQNIKKRVLKTGGENGMASAYEYLREKGLMNKAVIAADINHEAKDLTTEVKEGDKVFPLSFEDEEGKKVFWHTASHILAHAVKNLYPHAKLTIGPATDRGYYYDIDRENPFSADEIEKLEAEMSKIIKADYKIEKFTLPREEAKKLMEEKSEPYKVMLIDRVPEGEEISFYRQGDFVDLCAGPHLFSTGAVKAFKILQITGAYWEGDAKTKCCREYTE